MVGSTNSPPHHTNVCKMWRFCGAATASRTLIDVSPLNLPNLLIVRRGNLPAVSMDIHLLTFIKIEKSFGNVYCLIVALSFSILFLTKKAALYSLYLSFLLAPVYKAGNSFNRSFFSSFILVEK